MRFLRILAIALAWLLVVACGDTVAGPDPKVRLGADTLRLPDDGHPTAPSPLIPE